MNMRANRHIHLRHAFIMKVLPIGKMGVRVLTNTNDKVPDGSEMRVISASDSLSVARGTLFSATDTTFSVIDQTFSIADLTFSVTGQTNSVTDKTLSEADQTFSVADKTQSEADQTFSVTDKTLSEVDQTPSVAQKTRWWADNPVSTPFSPISGRQRAFSKAKQTQSTLQPHLNPWHQFLSPGMAPAKANPCFGRTA
jgi:hypothetical protein